MCQVSHHFHPFLLPSVHARALSDMALLFLPFSSFFFLQLGISNPSRIVLRKLAVSGFVELIGRDNLFLSVNEAAKTFSMTRATSARLPSSQRVVVELTENGHTHGEEPTGTAQVHSVDME